VAPAAAVAHDLLDWSASPRGTKGRVSSGKRLLLLAVYGASQRARDSECTKQMLRRKVTMAPRGLQRIPPRMNESQAAALAAYTTPEPPPPPPPHHTALGTMETLDGVGVPKSWQTGERPGDGAARPSCHLSPNVEEMWRSGAPIGTSRENSFAVTHEETRAIGAIFGASRLGSLQRRLPARL
jgi:hypothetical protein